MLVTTPRRTAGVAHDALLAVPAARPDAPTRAGAAPLSSSPHRRHGGEGQAPRAGWPQAAARGVPKPPRGDASGEVASSCGQTWVIEFPAGMELLNANDRAHWARRGRVTAELRRTAGWLARHHGVPALQFARVDAVYEPPNRRRRDPANWQPSFKACVDGLVDAGVLPDDDSTHLHGPVPWLGDVYPAGRIVLHITKIGGDQ